MGNSIPMEQDFYNINYALLNEHLGEVNYGAVHVKNISKDVLTFE